MPPPLPPPSLTLSSFVGVGRWRFGRCVGGRCRWCTFVGGVVRCRGSSVGVGFLVVDAVCRRSFVVEGRLLVVVVRCRGSFVGVGLLVVVVVVVVP